MDYRAINWEAERPELTAFIRDWDGTVITAIEPLDSRLTAVQSALVASHVNGGARVAQFQINAAPAVFWMLSRNRLNEYDFFERFFRHPNVVAALPEIVGPTMTITPTEFAMEAPFVVYGRLAGSISSGGAYRRFDGTDEEALQLADAFVAAAFDKRFTETTTWTSWKPWSDWFYGITWDASFFWFDTRTGVVTILLFTDTD
ncbi:hypothetical protein [Sphingomonas sp.]|uniref:hypothetical protein n=1 Tax=Sphingomonas sp. TaxID=28214 RepID=UPI003D6D9F3C